MIIIILFKKVVMKSRQLFQTKFKFLADYFTTCNLHNVNRKKKARFSESLNFCFRLKAETSNFQQMWICALKM